MKKWLKHRYLELVFWWHKKKWERLVDSELRPYLSDPTYHIFQDDTERKYTEGLTTVKSKINTMVKTKSADEYKRVLTEVKELVNLARQETPSQRALRKMLTSMAALPEKNKKAMIDDRIEHYKELQEYNAQRALIRKIKQARKNGNIELANELEQKWRTQYGKARDPRRR